MMEVAEYLNTYDDMCELVVNARHRGATWDEMEQILHDSMKDHDIPTGQEAKQWTNC